MRRLWCVVLLVVAGCAVRPQTVPGAAAPITATTTAAPGPAAPSVSGQPVPTDFATVLTSGFGVTVTISVPTAWTRKPSSAPGRVRTDVDLVDPEVVLRIDLTARVGGSARDGTLSNEKTARLPGYRRLDIAAVPDVGDDAVDWTFTFERDGTRQVVDRQIQQGTAVVAVYYSAPRELYQRYLPVWQNAVRKLTIRSS